MNKQARVRVDLDMACLGAICAYDISDANDVLLLRGGQPLTESVRDQFQERDIAFLMVHL